MTTTTTTTTATAATTTAPPTPSEPTADGAWQTALAAIDRGEVTPAIERAVIEAARRVKKRLKLLRRHQAQRVRDELRAQTGRVAASTATSSSSSSSSTSPAEPKPSASSRELPNHAHCYACKRPYNTLHPYYHALCVSCGDANFEKRTPTLDDLTGRRAILTGGRTKIGYRCALMLLRHGATVTITTRYPHDAARRFASEEDAEAWLARLRIEKADFRDIRAAHAFLDAELRRNEPLDILINHAAQTIRASAALDRAERERDRLFAAEHSPPRQQSHLMSTQGDHYAALPALPGRLAVDRAESLHAREKNNGIVRSSSHERIQRGDEIVCDRDHGEWVDANMQNTWDLRLEDVPLAEFFEVQLVNVFAPWAFTSRLLPLLRQSRFADRYIVQVSAIEGQFDGPPKTGKHPHTNMAKAALHMLVRTSAEPLAREGIYMNAVDPGWVSDQSAILRRNRTGRSSTDTREPSSTDTRGEPRPFCPPLDAIDGAARIVDPIARGMRGEVIHGTFLKNYLPAPW